MGLIYQRLGGYGIAWTGKLERRNPLPVGRYWIDIFLSNPDLAMWYTWLDTMGQSDIILVEAKESYKNSEYGDSEWYLFKAVKDAEYPIAEFFGFPTVATDNVHTRDDTVQKPPPEKGPLEQGGAFDQAKPWLIGGAIVVGLVAAASIVRNIRG